MAQVSQLTSDIQNGLPEPSKAPEPEAEGEADGDAAAEGESTAEGDVVNVEFNPREGN